MAKKEAKKTVSNGQVYVLFPGIKKIQDKLKEYPSLIHASNIYTKANDNVGKPESKKSKKLKLLIPEYIKYLDKQLGIKSYPDDCNIKSLKDKKSDLDDIIKKRVSFLNDYYNFFERNKIEDKDEGFDSRSKIRSTILEEFVFLLFKDFVALLIRESGDGQDMLKNGGVQSYSNMFFSASDVLSFIRSPLININTKQQDYAIYRQIDIFIREDEKIKANIPLLAVEVKTFLDKTMLEGAAATAEKIKMGSPYSVYIVVTETYAISYKVDPACSQLDQIFVLRKCRQERRSRIGKDIDANVVINMFWFVYDRLTRPWFSPEKRVEEDGIVI